MVGFRRCRPGRLWIAAGTACGLAVSASAARSATVYVDQHGVAGTCDDGHSYAEAQNAATPLCTIAAALTVAQAADEIVVRQGAYVPAAPIDVTVAGVTLRAYDGEAVTLDLSGAGDDKGVKLRADGVVLEGFEITGAHEECVQGYGTGTHAVVRHNHIHHCGLVKVDDKYQNCMDSDGDGMLIEANVMHDSGSHVLYITGNDVTVRNNILYRSTPPEGRGSYGIQVGTDGANMSRVSIVHNAIGESENRSGIVLYAPNGSIADVVIANNVFWDNAQYGVSSYNTATYGGVNRIQNNVFAGNVSGDMSDIPTSFQVDGNQSLASSAEVGWRDLPSHDLWPEDDSVLVDAALPGMADADLLDTARPQGPAPDIGPYEWFEGGGPPATGGSGGGTTAGGTGGVGADPTGGNDEGAAPVADSAADGGCGCRLGARPAGTWAWALLALGLATIVGVCRGQLL